MNVEYKSGDEQSDYGQGCIEIRANGVCDAFRLGEIFQRLVSQNAEAVRGMPASKEMCFIRVPIQLRKAP